MVFVIIYFNLVSFVYLVVLRGFFVVDYYDRRLGVLGCEKGRGFRNFCKMRSEEEK